MINHVDLVWRQNFKLVRSISTIFHSILSLLCTKFIIDSIADGLKCSAYVRRMDVINRGFRLEAHFLSSSEFPD